MIGTIDIRGGAELKRALTALSDELRRNVALEALWDGALPIEADMKALAPKDTGKLAQSIHIEAKPGRGDYPMVDVVVGGGLFRGETFYGGFIELGYRRGKRVTNEALGIRPRKRRTKEQREAATEINDRRPVVPPDPFVRPAFDRNVETIVGRILATLHRFFMGRAAA